MFRECEGVTSSVYAYVHVESGGTECFAFAFSVSATYFLSIIIHLAKFNKEPCKTVTVKSTSVYIQQDISLRRLTLEYITRQRVVKMRQRGAKETKIEISSFGFFCDSQGYLNAPSFRAQKHEDASSARRVANCGSSRTQSQLLRQKSEPLAVCIGSLACPIRDARVHSASRHGHSRSRSHSVTHEPCE